jgi:hypothetical protein
MFLRFLLLPLACVVLCPFFYFDLDSTQQTLATRSSLIFNGVTLVSAVSALVTAMTCEDPAKYRRGDVIKHAVYVID